jgi:hypothetical protein
MLVRAEGAIYKINVKLCDNYILHCCEGARLDLCIYTLFNDALSVS